MVSGLALVLSKTRLFFSMLDLINLFARDNKLQHNKQSKDSG